MAEQAPRIDRSPAELKLQLEAERAGVPFLVYRGGEGAQVIYALEPDTTRAAVGRGEACEVRLDVDPEVSRLHAELERIGDDWVLIDDGLSRNGSFVNAERVVGRRRLRDGDSLRFGDTPILFRAPAGDEAPGETEAATGGDVTAADVSETQRRVLIALCRPFREGESFATPATNKQIADEVFLSVDAVKAHLRALFERFELGELPQNEKRIRLAELSLKSGVVSLRDLES